MVIFTKLFLLDALERALKTAAQTSVALLTADGVSLISFNWEGFVLTVALATSISVLSSIASSGEGNSASLVVDNIK
jgi:r1t holin